MLSIVKRVDSSEVISGNESFHSMMTNGVNVIMRKDDEDRGDYIKLIDFDNPDNKSDKPVAVAYLFWQIK